MKKQQKVPCWVCKGSGVSDPEEFIGADIVKPEIECEWCDYGMIEIGSKKHKEYREFIIDMKGL